MRTRREPYILIASNTLDMPTVKPVAELLVRRGCRVIDYQADTVAYGLAPFAITMGGPKEGLTITYNGSIVDPGQIDAAWLRRPTDFGMQFESEDRAARHSVDNERAAAQQALWGAIPSRRWLNAPEANRFAGQKLSQLARARQLGFTVPRTVVANHWEDIQALPTKKIVFKSFYGTLLKNSGPSSAVFTTIFKNQPGKRPTASLPYPGIWQEYVPKAREWRITVVGDAVFDAAIYTTADAKDDWRRPADGQGVTYRRETFPEAEKRKCFALLRSYGLRFGAFDFIETPDGTIVFLEMNPNGQYGWLEDKLDLPISKAIADELLRIATCKTPLVKR